MDKKDETINQLANALWQMTKLFCSSVNGTVAGPAMDETESAINAAFRNGWRPPEMSQHN